MTTAAGHPIVSHQRAHLPELRAADRGVAESLEAILSDNTRRAYDAQWRSFTDWCDDVGLSPLPAEPLTVARYLAARAGSVATLRLAASAISKAHEWAKLESPCRDPGVRASLKGWGRRLAKPQRQSGALTADMLAVIRLTAVQPRRRGRGMETAEQAAERGKFDVALAAALSDAGLRRSEAAALTWDDVQLWRTAPAESPWSAPRPTGEPGRGGGHHACRHGGALRHPAGWRGQRREGLRAVRVPDRPAGEGHCPGRGVG